jgi:hypothetical protein
VQDAHIYDWIVFTSANGVEAFFEIFFKLYDDARRSAAPDRGHRPGHGAASERLSFCMSIFSRGIRGEA